jgi:hypothetical protein
MEKYRQASLDVLIDFDGTLAEFDYPDLGAPRPGALEFVRWLVAAGLKPVIWSSRMSRAHNDEAKCKAEVERLRRWLNKHDFPEECSIDTGAKGKRLALCYLDDRGVACDESTPWADVRDRVQYIHQRESARWDEYDATLNQED